MVVSITAAGGISLVIFNQLIEVANELPRYQQNIHNKIEAMRTPNKGPLGRAAATVKELGKELSRAPAATASATPTSGLGGRNTQNQSGRPLAVQIVEEPTTELQYVRDLTKPFLAPLGVFGIVLIFTVFLLIEQDDLRNRLFRLAGLDRLTVMTQALDDATRRVSRYLTMQFLVNASFGVFCGIGLYLIGVPYAVLWGAVAGILRIVPYVGSLVAAFRSALSKGPTPPSSKFAAGNSQLLHHGIQGRAWHPETSCRSADHAPSLPENSQDVFPLHFLERAAAGSFVGIGP